ncbi:OLC1v1004278C1 [Oldenlandia corymbosa var. corymbosa]|uniref:OLC1v1004278C1 n=1 Tax=Oldenlandia corymbosa var. corymbosa TaxID=529605 RepID=A0AAV1DBW0_OLDCO|nr:OLC1v1004278C1 [Oldenlandia corymbosa var. corymbosa]
MDIPLQFLLRMFVYDIDINGVKVKATLAKHDEVVENELSELKNSLMTTDFPVVGVDCKFGRNAPIGKDYDGFVPADNEWVPSLLALYVETRCLIIQLDRSFPSSLARFLNDENICFVGIKIDYHLECLKYHHHSLCKTSKAGDLTRYGVDIHDFAACVLKDPSLRYCLGLINLGRRIGVEIQEVDETISPPPSDWGAIVFSKEEVEYTVHDAYNCYLIGKKLLTSL